MDPECWTLLNKKNKIKLKVAGMRMLRCTLGSVAGWIEFRMNMREFRRSNRRHGRENERQREN